MEDVSRTAPIGVDELTAVGAAGVSAISESWAGVTVADAIVGNRNCVRVGLGESDAVASGVWVCVGRRVRVTLGIVVDVRVTRVGVIVQRLNSTHV